MNSYKDLKKLLEAETKESLIEIILSLVTDDESVEQRIKFQVSTAKGNEVLNECTNLIRSYMNKYADGGYAPEGG